MKATLIVCLYVVMYGVSLAAQATTPPRVPPNALIFVQDSDFGNALSAAFLKKKVPVSVTTIRDKAQFFVEESSTLDKEGTAERVTKVLAFGAFAGSGKTYEASVRVTNSDGVIVFAHNTKKGDIRSAAEDVANKLKDHITKK